MVTKFFRNAPPVLAVLAAPAAKDVVLDFDLQPSLSKRADDKVVEIGESDALCIAQATVAKVIEEAAEAAN